MAQRLDWCEALRPIGRIEAKDHADTHRYDCRQGHRLLWFALTARFCGRRLTGTSHAVGHVAEMAVTSALIPPLAVFWRLAGAVKYRVPFL